MEDIAGKVVVVTGGGSGIGRGLAIAFAERGARVVVADIEAGAAGAVADEVRALGTDALPLTVDVADAASVAAMADEAWSAMGRVDIVCNNAGVFLMGPIGEATVDDWTWCTSVNVMGVVHGIAAFVPRLVDQGSGHVVNTSSVAALGGGKATPVYSMTKAAVLSMSESLRAELDGTGVGVSVLLPANINSRILGAQRNRHERFGARANEPLGTDITTFGIDAIHVGRRAVDAVVADELYVFAFPEGWDARLRPSTATRSDAILAALDRGVVGT